MCVWPVCIVTYLDNSMALEMLAKEVLGTIVLNYVRFAIEIMWCCVGDVLVDCEHKYVCLLVWFCCCGQAKEKKKQLREEREKKEAAAAKEKEETTKS